MSDKTNSTLKDLLAKYDVPAPRYTSYPTVPYWEDSPTSEEWVDSIKTCMNEEDSSWSMYIHIPFCETLCTFCGCNTTITKDHKREEPYLQKIVKEWSLYLERVPALKERPLRELHLPRKTTADHLQKLYDIGFHRVSMGVQDFDLEVQKLVNRIQPEEITKDLTDAARSIGYTSVNYDLIYGLPKQDVKKIIHLVERTIVHKPDRIALYSFALVPWMKPTHRIFKDEDLPVGADKRELYEVSRKMLLDAGYVEIGMDHFALKTDSLYKSLENGKLHRNFMGYTANRTDLLLGLGVSSISETPDMFHQNEKKLTVYEREIESGKLATSEDKEDLKAYLKSALEDQLMSFKGDKLEVPEKGRPFLRNICMGLDKRLRSKNPDRKVFSQSI